MSHDSYRTQRHIIVVVVIIIIIIITICPKTALSRCPEVIPTPHHVWEPKHKCHCLTACSAIKAQTAASRYSQRNLRLCWTRCTFTEMIVSNACYLPSVSLSLRISTDAWCHKHPCATFSNRIFHTSSYSGSQWQLPFASLIAVFRRVRKSAVGNYKLRHVRPFAWTTRVPLDGFSWNLIRVFFDNLSSNIWQD